MLGTVVKMNRDRVKIQVKNDAACCNGGSGGCACGGADPVYVEALIKNGLDVQEGDMVEFSAQDSALSGILKVFGFPGLIFLAAWNLTPLVTGRPDQPLQLGASLVLAALALAGAVLVPSRKGLPVVNAKLPSFNLKALAL